MNDAPTGHDDNGHRGDEIDATERPLLDALRASLAADDLPVGMNEASESLLGWLDIDDELDSLLADADVEQQAVRSDVVDVTELATRDGSPVVEWSVDGSVISGLVMVDSIIAVEAQHADGEIRRATLSDLGRFTLDGVASGPVRLRLLHHDGHVEHTRWFVV